jgi:hypothetical protein
MSNKSSDLVATTIGRPLDGPEDEETVRSPRSLGARARDPAAASANFEVNPVALGASFLGTTGGTA